MVFLIKNINKTLFFLTQSLTKLSSFLLDLEIQQLEITKNFGPDKFRDFIRDQIYKTGVEGVGICFIITDTQIVFESMLEDVNNLLNSGEVPNIFEQVT
jgi:dynein heavy chain, axonemal